MTAEQFHDALTALPAELVAQADLRRSHPRTRRRFVPLAAGLAAVLLCGFVVNGMFHGGGRATESAVLMEKEAAQGADSVADEAAPMEAAPVAPPETAPIPQPEVGIAEDATSREPYPGVTLLTAVEATLPRDSAVNLQSPAQAQVIARKSDLPEALNLPELTADWFENHDLLALFLQGYPEPPEILGMEQTGQITLPAPRETEKAWYLLLQTPKAQFTQDQITLIFTED